MKYYLPITINERRLHVCHLEENNTLNPTFSFIINKEADNLQVFSINTDDAKLISTVGYDKDVKLSNLKTKIEFISSDINSLPIYYINLYKGENEKSKNNGLVSKGFLNSSTKPFHIDIDKTKLAEKTNFVVVICYKNCDNNEYSYAFKVHLCANDNLIEAAMDFGSEASQIRIKEDGANMKLVKEFRKFHTQDKNKDDFWQGNLNDALYKSIFFLHKNPDKTKYAEVPNANEEKTHIKTLLPKVTEQNKYDNLEILPNMKLIELINLGEGNRFNFDIDFSKGNPHNNGMETTLADEKTRNGTLRLILSNFLYCILKHKLNSPQNNAKRCLRIVLLMPNVYHQKKVYTIIKNLYEDFYTITRKNDYSQYAGIEIQVVSESDAAFVGTKKDQNAPTIDATNGYFLIIDAGKGTTDFSILRQQGNFSEFDSNYRAGIPASGHIITYAFYEAIRDYLNTKEITLNDKLKSADRSILLIFMNIVEKFKINFEKSKDGNNIEDIDINSLEDVNSFLRILSKKMIRIPNSEEKVNEKINELVNKLQEAIEYGVKSNSDFKQFEQVILTGRGFLFNKFKNAIKTMLIDKKWISSEDLIFAYSTDRAKSICLDGAFSTTGEIEINKNSELIGRPIIQRRVDVSDKWFKRNWNCIYDYFSKKINKSDVNLGADFFYKGKSTNLQSPVVRVGGREAYPNLVNKDEKRFYFIGDGFVFQTKNSIIPFKENYINSEWSDLVKQTLFPFFKDSIPKKEIINSSVKQIHTHESSDEEKKEVPPATENKPIYN